MPTHITVDENGVITAQADWPFPNSHQVDFNVVRGLDGRLYKAGDEPAPALNEIQSAKRAEINAGFDAAMTASLTMPSRSAPPSAVELALAIEDFKTDDPTGWADLRAIHSARRDVLLSAVDAASSVEAVNSIVVTYAV